MRRTILTGTLAAAVICLPALVGCQTERGDRTTQRTTEYRTDGTVEQREHTVRERPGQTEVRTEERTETQRR
jgi:hypothetical protein